MAFKIHEDPTRSTSGLTSAMQIVDVTDGIRNAYENATSRDERIVNIILKLPTLKLEIERQKFKEALKRTIARDINILKELSKY
ncbi:MAG: hypothetical protein QXU45_09765 [Candidatus Bathyarchaeia archaeon]